MPRVLLTQPQDGRRVTYHISTGCPPFTYHTSARFVLMFLTLSVTFLRKSGRFLGNFTWISWSVCICVCRMLYIYSMKVIACGSEARINRLYERPLDGGTYPATAIHPMTSTSELSTSNVTWHDTWIVQPSISITDILCWQIETI